MLHIQSFTFGPFQENTYLLYDDSKEAILIDPGCSGAEEELELFQFITKHELKLVKLVNTHCHIDHVMGWEFVENTWGLQPYFHPKDAVLLERVSQQAKQFGLEFKDFPKNYGQAITEAETLNFGNTSLDIFFCPGHAPGHLIFHHPESNQCIVGDVIFRQSVGRTDLPFCNSDDLVNSIQNIVYKLPDETVLHSGHGPKTTVGFEKLNNPFVRA
ncbi:MAG: MBL fold metallo-hydrolase [Flavobacteriales bacterium]